MSSFKLKVITVIIGFIFALALSEILAHWYLSIADESGQAKKVQTSTPEKITQTKKHRLPVVHPFWAKANVKGKARFPGQRNKFKQMILEGEFPPQWANRLTNNHGFVSAIDYPQARKNNDYFIAILGGSVAHFFTLLGEQALIAELKKQAFFKDKNIILLNFANGAFKQPQQLMILNYFLVVGQEIDLIVNIDGFNEAALSMTDNVRRKIDISLPRVYPGPLKTLLKAHSTESVLWQAERIRLQRKIQHLSGGDKQFALKMLIDNAQRQWLENRLAEHMKQVPSYDAGKDSGFFHLPLDKKIGKDRIQQQIVDQWLTSSKLIHAAAKAHHIRYIHILQPNQYYTKRQFSREEQLIAFGKDSDKHKPSHRYAKAIIEIYPQMEQRLFQEQAEGLPIVSGLQLFDAEPKQVYADACCHYTDIGNRLMAAFIAGLVLQHAES